MAELSCLRRRLQKAQRSGSLGLLGLRSPRVGRAVVRVTAFLVVCAGSTVVAQKVFTAREVKVVEKTVGIYFEATTTAIASKDYENAKVKLVVTREYLARSWTFWNMNKQADAGKMVTAAVASLDALDNALSEVTVDPNAVNGAVMQATAACAACHAAFRVQNPTTKTYEIKPGLIGWTAHPNERDQVVSPPRRTVRVSAQE